MNKNYVPSHDKVVTVSQLNQVYNLMDIYKNIKHKLYKIKEMQNSDKSEILKVDLWKHNRHVKVFGTYNPPNNKLISHF